MPFPDLQAAGFSALEDSQFFQDTPISGAITYETDGGIFMSRKRFTRNPGRNLVTGFTQISPADKALLDQLYVASGSGSAPISYVHPITKETLSVFISTDPPYTSAYSGLGSAILWTITDIKLRTA